MALLMVHASLNETRQSFLQQLDTSGSIPRKSVTFWLRTS